MQLKSCQCGAARAACEYPMCSAGMDERDDVKVEVIRSCNCESPCIDYPRCPGGGNEEPGEEVLVITATPVRRVGMDRDKVCQCASCMRPVKNTLEALRVQFGDM